MTTTSPVVTREGRIVTITFNDPENGNRLTPPVLATLTAVVNELVDDQDAQVVIITGSGTEYFSSGILSPAIRKERTKDDIGLVWFDAHGDCNTPRTTRSGMLGGMPVAVCAGLAHPGWRERSHTAAPLPTDRILMVDVRNLDPEEEQLIRATDITIAAAPGFPGADLARSVAGFGARCDLHYLHIDSDILQIIREAEGDRRERPLAGQDQHHQANRPEDLPKQADGGKQPAALRNPLDLHVHNAIQANHHPQTRENLRMVLVGEPREAEEPLRIIGRIQAPEHVVDARQAEGDAVLAAVCDHARANSVKLELRADRDGDTRSRHEIGDGLFGHPELQRDEGRGEPALAQIDQQLQLVVFSAGEQVGEQCEKLAPRAGALDRVEGAGKLAELHPSPPHDAFQARPPRAFRDTRWPCRVNSIAPSSTRLNRTLSRSRA